jgi:hypothetical protein
VPPLGPIFRSENQAHRPRCSTENRHIAGCAQRRAKHTHFLIEHIHPFRDGNGRMGRLWQTLVMSRWRPVFAWMPTETLIRHHQLGYYQALQDSRVPDIDAATFIDFMLGVITESLAAYETRALASDRTVGANVGEGVGVNEALLRLLTADTTLSAAALAERLGTTSRTIERHLAGAQSPGAASPGWASQDWPLDSGEQVTDHYRDKRLAFEELGVWRDTRQVATGPAAQAGRQRHRPNGGKRSGPS